LATTKETNVNKQALRDLLSSTLKKNLAEHGDLDQLQLILEWTPSKQSSHVQLVEEGWFKWTVKGLTKFGKHFVEDGTITLRAPGSLEQSQ